MKILFIISTMFVMASHATEKQIKLNDGYTLSVYIAACSPDQVDFKDDKAVKKLINTKSFIKKHSTFKFPDKLLKLSDKKEKLVSKPFPFKRENSIKANLVHEHNQLVAKLVITHVYGDEAIRINSQVNSPSGEWTLLSSYTYTEGKKEKKKYLVCGKLSK